MDQLCYEAVGDLQMMSDQDVLQSLSRIIAHGHKW
jgi:hypothetical protein